MTEFEMQVAEALAVAWQYAIDEKTPGGSPLAMLAPRVAAAIQAAATRGVNLGVMDPGLPYGLEPARQLALAALRGEP